MKMFSLFTAAATAKVHCAAVPNAAAAFDIPDEPSPIFPHQDIVKTIHNDARQGNFDTVKGVLQQGNPGQTWKGPFSVALANAVDKTTGKCLLHCIAECPKSTSSRAISDLIQVLVRDQEVDVNACDASKKTAWHIAREFNFKNVQAAFNEIKTSL